MRKIVRSRAGLDELDGIVAFVAQDNPIAAGRVADRIERAALGRRGILPPSWRARQRWGGSSSSMAAPPGPVATMPAERLTTVLSTVKLARFGRAAGVARTMPRHDP